MQFQQKQIIWAKVKNSPWWPAEISKLPNKQTQFFKVYFIGEATHAFLQPSDVKKYIDNHKEFSAKKSKKLQNAIQKADELIKIRLPPKKEPTIKTKPQSKRTNNPLHSDDNSSQIEQEECSSRMQQSNYSTEKENQQAVTDRKKIDKVQTELLQVISYIKELNNQSNINIESFVNYFKNYDRGFLSPEQLCQSKVTKMLSFICKNVSEPQKSMVTAISRDLKDKILCYLNNTDYYDHSIKLVTKVKNQRATFERSLSRSLRRQYGVKKQLAQFFSLRFSEGIVNCSVQLKDVLKDFKCKKIQANLSGINTKVAAQRIAEEIIARYQ